MISIHPPREGWDYMLVTNNQGDTISIHPPREGWDSLFYSFFAKYLISIHPPREGWDRKIDFAGSYALNFNPPTPRGVGRP